MSFAANEGSPAPGLRYGVGGAARRKRLVRRMTDAISKTGRIENGLLGDIIGLNAGDHDRSQPHLCVPKTLSELMARWNRLSWWNDWAVLFRYGRAGLAVQVKVPA